MASRALAIAALTAAGLLLLTFASAFNRWGEDESSALTDRPQRPVDSEPTASGPCSIFQARFGGSRAQLIKVMRGSVPNYVVLEVGRREPLVRHQRGVWLRGAFGDGEQTWLGEFASPEAAMTRATRLCPPALRCGPGEADCGPQAEPITPVKAFMHL